jgi:hypothetical protein
MTQRESQLDQEMGFWLVDGAEDVPEFATDSEETAFWETHDFSEEFWKGATRLPPEHLAAGRGDPASLRASASQELPIAFAAGVIVGAALVLGAAYLLIPRLRISV